jgi:hypothetical protein
MLRSPALYGISAGAAADDPLLSQVCLKLNQSLDLRALQYFSFLCLFIDVVVSKSRNF